MRLELTKETIAAELQNTLDLLEPHELAYLFTGGKNELLIRDLFALHLTRKYPGDDNYHIAREWSADRLDLAVVDGNHPLGIIEGKAWIHNDSLSDSKLITTKKSIRNGFLNDVKKMYKYDIGGFIQTYCTTVFYTLEKVQKSPIQDLSTKYISQHRVALKNFPDIESLLRISEERILSVFYLFGDSIVLNITPSVYKGIKLYLQIYVTALNFERMKELLPEYPEFSTYE